MSAEKVVRLTNEKLFDDINSFFVELDMNKKEGEKHSSTRVSYESTIRQFFKIMTPAKKDLEHLTEADLNFSKADIKHYRSHMKENLGYSNSTINKKMTTMKSLYEELRSIDYDVNPSIFKLKRLKTVINSYGELSHTEADRFAEAALSEAKLGYLKHCMILFATRTSFRLNEILNIKWSDFELENGVYKVKTVLAKGNKERTTSISEKLYNKILILKEENEKFEQTKQSEYVFPISEKSINRMMTRLKNVLNVSPERNVVFHSFRAVAIDFAFETEGVEAAIKHSGHSNYDVLIKHYIKNKKDYTQTPGVKMDEEMDWSFMDQMSVEDFKEFFKQSNQYKLYTDLKNFKRLDK
ncbi:tyrosine-type recombinase/integrase [Fictibacillus nanhaiensis]|uniref:tyrosine-type recombinase/integrase n=1 Tax=Fictibacillus nanhaiensis TaxID=742169 RepID=UPI002E20F459|nr:tyrosine-type recombinase/integrase [Fictibacillus nanhaiensis]MED1863323.1 tyrosine-type recombinase/integrase [Fictibacillus nanhaiensis]